MICDNYAYALPFTVTTLASFQTVPAGVSGLKQNVLEMSTKALGKQSMLEKCEM